jgi:hypothetical protein
LTDVFHSQTRNGRRFPTMKDFYDEVALVLNKRGYRGDVAANVVAATTGRLKQLLLGSIGFMLNVKNDADMTSPERLFSQPVVLELNDLNLQDKALVIMFLLTMLREWRELNPADHLIHVTVIEEAHNVLGEVKSQGTGEGAGSDTRAKSVEAFCNMLAEVRSLGQGLIISDQSPNKLAADAMRNTNVQIAHQLRDGNDRDSIANAMIMDQEQRDFLGKLSPGSAAIFFTGLQKATFFTAHEYRAGIGAGFGGVTDSHIRAYMTPLTPYRRSDLPFPGCLNCGCRKTCDHRTSMVQLFDRSGPEQDRSFDRISTQWIKDKDQQKLIASSAALGVKVSESLGLGRNTDAAWCFVLHAWSRAKKVQKSAPANKFRSSFVSYISQQKKP